MASIENNRAVRITRRMGRILASIACLFFALLVASNSIEGASYSYFALEIPIMVLVILAIALGAWMTRWKDLPAGISMAALSAIVGAMANFNNWLVFGVPFLVAGILFILSWLLSMIDRESLKEAKLL